MVCVGIDVAKDKHDCFILSSEGEVLADVFTIANNRDGFELLFQTIRSCARPTDNIKVGLEATGHYSYNILGFLLENGLHTFLINPLHTNLYRKSLSLRQTKTDRIDARTIASMLMSEKERFIGELKREDNTAWHIYEVGDKLFFEDRGTVYNDDGTVFSAFDGDCKGDCFIGRKNEQGGYPVYDSNLKEIAVLDANPVKAYNHGALFAIREESSYVIVERGGARVGELSFKYAPEEWGNFLYGKDPDSNTLVMDFDGKTIVSAKDGFASYAYSYPFGFLELKASETEYGLVYPDGTVIRGLDYYNRDLVITWKQDGKTAVLILDDKDFSLTSPEHCYGVGLFLATLRENDRYVLYNIVNGEKLLESESFRYSNDYLYARTGDVYEIYRVDYQG